MKGHTAGTKLLSLFVTAFVCLNALGAVCVAYCRVADVPEATAAGEPSHHCEMMAAKASESGNAPALSKPRDIRPCPMTVSFFGGPIEKHSVQLAKAAPSGTAPIGDPRLDPTVFEPLPATLSYRGPPLLDRRTERIKHRLLLI